MKMVEPQFEIFRIPESVSLPSEGLDLVDQAFDGPAGDAMIEQEFKESWGKKHQKGNQYNKISVRIL